jgi:hypothetical protein
MSDLVTNRDAASISGMTVNQRESLAGEMLGEWKARFDTEPASVVTENPQYATFIGAMQRMAGLISSSGRHKSGGEPFKKDDKGNLVVNDNWWQDAPFNPYMMRVAWMQALIDPRRNLDYECGYPTVIIPKQYRFMYDREGVARRVVDIYPDECWSVDPVLYDTEDKHDRTTPFTEDWDNLCDDNEVNPLHYLHRTDILSGVGRYGILLIGTDDGEDLSVPLPHIDSWGRKVKGQRPLNILYQRPFDELMCHVINYERDPTNPRFGRPVYYHVLFADVRVGEPGMTAANISVTSRIVHWSRCIHIADNRESSEVFGVPRMQPVFNRLCDVRKILGGSSEMFWKGGFPGLSIELDPTLTTAGVTTDTQSIDEQMQRYADGLQRYIGLVGMTAKSLAPQVANPEGNIRAQLEAIAISIGVPLRIFTGSEQAQLASGQDVRTWNRRLTKRHHKYLSPQMLRPYAGRLVAFGTLRPPKDERYKIFWPDVNMPSEDDRSKIADRIAATMLKYITGGVFQVFPPLEWFTNVMGIPQDQAMAIVAAAKKGLGGLEIKTPAVMQMEAEPKDEGQQGGGFGKE